jgi:hypothetical protein
MTPNTLPPDNEFDPMDKGLILRIAEKMPLTLRVKDPEGMWPKLVWIDQEYVSVDYAPHGFYWVFKRAELGLARL